MLYFKIIFKKLFAFVFCSGKINKGETIKNILTLICLVTIKMYQTIIKVQITLNKQKKRIPFYNYSNCKKNVVEDNCVNFHRDKLISMS